MSSQRVLVVDDEALNLMLIDRLKHLETQALAEAQSGEDPDALQRYKSLYERRRELIAQSS